MDHTRPDSDSSSNTDSAAVARDQENASGQDRPGLSQSQFETSCHHELLRRITEPLPRSLVRRLARYVRVSRIRNQPDRKYLETVIFPCLRRQNFSKVLFVGCREYTMHLGTYFKKTETEYWTADIDETVAFCGEPGRHVICDARELGRHFPAGSFDNVIFNGVFGYGIDDRAGMNQALAAIHRILRPGGLLLLGWHLHRVPEPRELEDFMKLFEVGCALELPDRKSFDGIQRKDGDDPWTGGRWHVYDAFTARPVETTSM